MRKVRARPDPVSCQSCRSKKLKCNRVQPCSNCAARNIPCNFLVAPPRESNAELVARIEVLESIVLKQSSSYQNISQDHSEVISQQLLSPRSESNALLTAHHGRDQDSRLLEEIGTREDSLVCYFVPKNTSTIEVYRHRVLVLISLTMNSFLACQMGLLSE